MAASYRAVLEDIAPDECHELDKQMLEMGQDWAVPRIATWNDDDYLSAAQVADCVGVNLKTVYEWRARGLSSIRTNEGIRFRYADVRVWANGQRSK